MKKIAIYGASGHGKVVADIAEICGYKVEFFVDDDDSKKEFCGMPVYGFEFAKTHRDICFGLGIGKNSAREKVFELLISNEFRLPFLIHPSAVISKSVIIGKGTVIMPNVVVNAYASIGMGVILNSSSIIEHDVNIGEFAHISPGSAIAGGVEIGVGVHLGINSTVIQGLKIGRHSVIGAGSVVIRDIEANSLVVGAPAKEIKKI